MRFRESQVVFDAFNAVFEFSVVLTDRIEYLMQKDTEFCLGLAQFLVNLVGRNLDVLEPVSKTDQRSLHLQIIRIDPTADCLPFSLDLFTNNASQLCKLLLSKHTEKIA